jgi:hypothetical protein
MMSLRRIFVLLAFGLLSLLSGIFLFQDVSLDIQFKLASFLATMAATIFAIFGVWIAVLQPKEFLDAPINKQKTPSQELVLELLLPWIYATVMFVLLLITTFTIGLLSVYLEGCSVIQGFFGGILVFCLLALLNSILSTLIPVARIRKDVREKELRAKYRS